ncbi:MAG TPA: 23S rRNA (guanosine(2251)-2'-O)-methyltransferase RlmB [Thermodesulfovibrionales bacterium]|nr:23S rRNA (guanosine(2251)-2'-O)-methyltransferase RlmB [Thermodesulfovibrionales bacterium]
MKIRRTGPTGRSKSDHEWIYGLNPVLEAIRSGRNIRNIYLSSARHEKIHDVRKEADSRNLPIIVKDPGFFDGIFGKGHQGVAAEVAPKEYVPLDELLEVPILKQELAFFLVVDCLEDPRNLGALLRVADAAGVHGIVLQAYRSVGLGAEVSKVSAGAVEYVPVAMVPNIKYAINEMKKNGILIIGAETAGEKTPWDLDLNVPLAVVIGSEGKGIRQTVRSLCDILVNIPMRGTINSLNASVAAGILAFEILRQRTQK